MTFYRYGLERRVWSLPYGPDTSVLFIMLNPSTADDRNNDHTIRRCIGFTRAWGFTRFSVVNLFAMRSTDPAALYATGPAEVIGDENDAHIIANAMRSDLVVCAWGTDGALYGRGREVAERLRDAHVKLHHLGLTKFGYPKHPLRLPASTQPIEWVLP